MVLGSFLRLDVYPSPAVGVHSIFTKSCKAAHHSLICLLHSIASVLRISRIWAICTLLRAFTGTERALKTRACITLSTLRVSLFVTVTSITVFNNFEPFSD
jgi:hypothetical protein